MPQVRGYNINDKGDLEMAIGDNAESDVSGATESGPQERRPVGKGGRQYSRSGVDMLGILPMSS